MQQMIFIADLIGCSTCFGHHYAHHQELESILQVVATCRIWCLVFKLSVWCGAKGCVSGLRAPRSTLDALIFILHPVSCHTPEVATTVSKCSWGCRALLQLLINMLLSCITLVLYIYFRDKLKFFFNSRCNDILVKPLLIFGSVIEMQRK